MAKTVKVEMNKGMPDLTIKQAKKAIKKHTDLGAGSPLTGFVDMVVFGDKVTEAENLRQSADEKVTLFQGKYNQGEMLAGTGAGQNKDTPGTIYFGVQQVRGILLVKHRGTEELLQGYGFNVVITQVGARKNVRVDIPYKEPVKMTELGASIVAKHTALGVGSPLTGNIDMTVFGTLVTDAAALFGEWDTAKGDAQELHNQAIVIIGYGPGQTKDTPGTIYYDRCSMRDRLLQKYQGTEELLTGFGFDVVISTHAAGGKKGAANTFVVQIEVPAGLNGNIDFSEIEGQGNPPTSVDFEAKGSNANYYASATADGLPGVGGLAVLNGNKVTKTPIQLTTELGIGDAKPFLKVVNTGNTSGIYTVTFHLGEGK